MGVEIEIDQWYYSFDKQAYTPYNGPSPINLESLNIVDANVETYVTRVINSFNN